MKMPDLSDPRDQIDWAGLVRLGLGAMRLAPDVFWAMSPAELRLALEGAGFLAPDSQLPMDQNSLAQLMAAYPDQTGPIPNSKE